MESSLPSWSSARTSSRTASSLRGSCSATRSCRCATAQARLAVLHDYAEREELGDLLADLNATFNDDRLELARAGEELSADLSGEPDPVARNEEEKAISLRTLSSALSAAAAASEQAYLRMRESWFERVLGADRDDEPRSYHMAYVRRLSPLESTYTKERATDICLATLKELGFDLAGDPNIKPDLDDRPQKAPRACVIASDPPTVVHLITRAQGGLHDYQAFLHEAGHALHYAGCDPSLPYTFRRLSRDHALTEIYSYIVEAISREPGWHALHFGLSDEEATRNAEATTFLEALLYRRYTAKLDFELDFWSRFHEDGGTSEGYAEKLTAATGVRYRSDGFISDMDAGFYSADYLRAWIRSSQLRAKLVEENGEDWWRSADDGRPAAGAVLRGHEAFQRGDRRAARLRSARHRTASARAGRGVGNRPRGGEVRRHAGEEPARGHAGRRQGRPGAGQGAPRGDPWREPEPRPEAAPDPPLQAEVEPQPEPDVVPEPDSEPEPEPAPRADVLPEPEPEPAAEPEPVVTPEPELAAPPEPEPVAPPEAEPDPPRPGLFARLFGRR